MTEKKPSPALYLVATPIGNLRDITLRALDTLHAADLILCEDTRVTGKLLQHYGIQKPLAVYNEQREKQDHTPVIDKIRAGAVVALVSDAGMPLLSDPGYQLVQACLDADIPVTSLPGASAILTALQLSGLPSDAFLFLGFLPNKTTERKTKLRNLADVPATIVLFERATRVPDLLRDIQETLGPRNVAVARELTKLFEDVRRGAITAVQQSLITTPIKGEVVVLIDRAKEPSDATDDTAIIAALRTHMATKPLRVAVDDVCGLLALPRRRVYELALQLRDDDPSD